MITIIPLKENPVSFDLLPTQKKPRPPSAIVFSRKNSAKATLQIRISGFVSASGHVSRAINVWLTGEEVKALADAMLKRAGSDRNEGARKQS